MDGRVSAAASGAQVLKAWMLFAAYRKIPSWRRRTPHLQPGLVRLGMAANALQLLAAPLRPVLDESLDDGGKPLPGGPPMPKCSWSAVTGTAASPALHQSEHN